MAREYIRVTPEITPGTYNAVGTPVIIDIDAANGYTARATPVRVTMRTAASSNRRAVTIAEKKALTGNLNFTVRGSYAALLVDWCIATTDATHLKTYSVDHCIVLEDTGSTKLLRRDLGMYCQQATINASEQEQWLKAQLQLVGLGHATITSTDFPEPALADYPTDPFLTFEDATAGLTISSETRLDIETFNLTIKNLLDIRYFLGEYPLLIKCCGRDVDASTRCSYKTNQPRIDFEAMNPIALSILFDNGTNQLSMDFQTSNYYATVADQIDNGKAYLQELTLESHLDYASGDDLEMTST